MNKTQSNNPRKIQLYANGAVSQAEVFVDGVYLYTRAYWASLSPLSKLRLAEKHPGIRNAFDAE